MTAISNNLPLIIKGDNPKLLSVELKDILVCINDGDAIKWSILYLYAVATPLSNRNIIAFEEEINNAKILNIYSWKEINEISHDLAQIWDIILIGAFDSNKLKRYPTTEEMRAACDYTIELVDSGFWLFHSRNILSTQNIVKYISGVEHMNNLDIICSCEIGA